MAISKKKLMGVLDVLWEQIQEADKCNHDKIACNLFDSYATIKNTLKEYDMFTRKRP